MWLGKMFGGRKRPPEIDPGEEPARFAAPVPPEETPVSQDLKRRTQDRLQSQSGFDPYNSGTFKKKDNAWERVGRR
jgi:hypothetical protein